jgi:hypothetical protein
MVIKVETVRPPNMVIPKGRQVSDPTPVDMANGNKPARVVIVVINTGLSLS